MPCKVPDFIVHRSMLDFDATKEMPWHVADFKIDSLIWPLVKGQEIIGLVDTGVSQSHVATGQLKDQVIHAKDFTNSQYGPYDANGHGSHTAGIMVASEFGIAKNCAKVVSAKCLGDDGSGTDQQIAAGLDWCVSQGATLINASLGSEFPSPTINAAVQRANAKGCFVVFAAGNSSGPVEQPAHDFGGVSALTRERTLATFSCFGAEVYAAAPGVQITSLSRGGGYAVLSGTCIAEGSMIYGPHGPKPIESVNAGDVVFAFSEGRIVERVVAARHFRGRNTVRRVHANGRSVLATETHQFLTVDKKRKELDWVKASDLNENHIALMPKAMETQVNPYLDSVLSEDACWLLGFFAGDGWVGITNGGSRVSFALGDDQIMNRRIEEKFSAVVGRTITANKQQTWAYCDSTRLACIITSLGLNDTCCEKTIPQWIYSLPRHKQIAFYCGYRDADGHTHRDAYDVFECASPSMVNRLAVLQDYFGWKHGMVRSRTRKNKAPNNPNHKEFCTSWSLHCNRTPADGGWCNLRGSKSDRRELAVQMGIDVGGVFAGTPVVDQEEQSVNVWDLSVPNADCFVSGGMIAHNSMAAPWVTAMLSCKRAYDVQRGKTPPKTKAEWIAWLTEDSDDLGTPGKDAQFGVGVLNASKFAEVPLPPVVAPPVSPPTPAIPPPTAGSVGVAVTMDGKTWFRVPAGTQLIPLKVA